MKDRTRTDRPRPSIQRPSPQRLNSQRLVVNRNGVAEFSQQEAICRISDICGSCPSIDKPYRDQLTAKTKDLETLVAERESTLGRITVRPCAASPRTLGYRHVAKLVTGEKRERMGKRWIEIGLYQPNSHKVVDVGRCPAQCEAINDLLALLRKEIWKHDISVFDPRSRTGLLRYVVIRTAHTGSGVAPQVLLTLVTSAEKSPKLKAFARDLSSKMLHLQGILQHVNDTPGNAIFHLPTEEDPHGGTTETLTGTPFLTDRLCELNFRFSSTSFMQVNPWTAEKVYYRMAELSNLQAHETLLDLYCGSGTIALTVGSEAGRIIGIEETPSSVQDARYNAERNSIAKATFHEGKVEDLLPLWLEDKTLTHVDMVTLNPSRRGCQPQSLKALAALQPRQILYMSCHARTLLRDLEILKPLGYEALFLEPFDMFPGTEHYETLACLQRRG